MSGRETDEDEADLPEPEATAAEFVLGTLPEAERRAAEARLARDPALAAAVAAWQARLAPLDSGYAEVAPPPDLLDRIEARLFGRPAARPRWRFPVLGGALAASVLVLVLTLAPLLAPPHDLVAELTGADAGLVLDARFEGATGILSLDRRAGPEIAEGQALELWRIDESEVPASLGLLSDAPVAVPGLKAGDILAVSLEPAGGSPTGQPTGPVLASAILARP